MLQDDSLNLKIIHRIQICTLQWADMLYNYIYVHEIKYQLNTSGVIHLLLLVSMYKSTENPLLGKLQIKSSTFDKIVLLLVQLQNKDSLKQLIESRFMTLLCAVRPFLMNGNEWKHKNFWAAYSLYWLMTHVSRPNYSRVLDVIIPMILKITDDPTASSKKIGSKMLLLLLDNLDISEVRQYIDLILKVVMSSLVFRRVDMIQHTLPCAIKVLSLMIPDHQVFMSQHYQMLLGALIKMANYSDDIEEKVIITKYLAKVTDKMQITVVLALEQLMGLLCSIQYLYADGLTDKLAKRKKKLCINTLNCLTVIVQYCWPRIDMKYSKQMADATDLIQSKDKDIQNNVLVLFKTIVAACPEASLLPQFKAVERDIAVIS